MRERMRQMVRGGEQSKGESLLRGGNLKGKEKFVWKG
jgi:hypothetical protein